MSSTVEALALSSSGELYAGGYFTTAGGVSANRVAKWDGSAWSALGSGVNNAVRALTLSGGELYAGGDFTAAGGKVSAYVAKARIALVTPTLTATTSSSIRPTRAILGGTVTSDGGEAVTVRGVVYAPTATNGDPDLGELGVIEATSSDTTSVFTVPVSGLTPNTTYSFKAYATNSAGTGYSDVDTFKTPVVLTYVLWTADNGLIGEDALPTATPFHDGIPNALKYAFNMNGGGPDCHSMIRGGDSGLPVAEPQVQGESRTLRFEFVQRRGSGLIYAPQVSRTLLTGSWLDIAAALSPIPVAGKPEWERVVVEEPVGTDDTRVFGRLQVTVP